MEGVQKLFYLPEPHTDFIFANICEELGLIGRAGSWSGCLCSRLPRAARGGALDRSVCAVPGVRDHVSAMLIQAFFNISVVLALVPTKGITLPLISFGGTSVFITLASHGRAAEHHA